MDWLLEQWSYAPSAPNNPFQSSGEYLTVLSYICPDGPYHWTDEDNHTVNAFFIPTTWEPVQ